MKAADQCRQYMTVGWMVIVVGPVKVGWHHRNIVCAILAIQIFTVFQSADLCQSICFISLFQLRSQKTAFLHRLRSHSWINTGASQKFQLLTAVFPGTVNHIHLEDHVFIHEIRKCLAVCDNTANFCGCEKYIIRFLCRKELFYSILPCQIKLLMRAGNNVVISLPL